MDGGGNTPRNEERAAEKLMDDYLKSLGLHRKKIAKDGSCLFRAVAEQVLHSQSLHTKVRSRCVEFLKQNRDSYEAFIEGDFEDYLFKLQDPQQWVGEVEINALAVMYKRDFVIFQEPGKPAVNITDNNFKDKVQLCFLNGNHYDSVYPISHFKNAALCQSILYELLYDGVFKVERSSLPCQRTSRPSDLLSDDNMAVCGSSDESDLDAAEPLWVENGTSTRHNNQSHRGRGRGRPLPERVRRSLNPTLFRNIEFDVWHKTKRAQQKMDYCIAAGMQFAAGDRCQVRLDGSGRTYNATIKEVAPNNGPVTVHIEELGRKQVPLWWLRRLPSDENSWSTVVNRDKRLSNGHGEWEERAKGRGRGKHALASSSSVAQATAPGSSGRVQRQHTWPQQATVEEQGGAKGNRKSVSSVDSAFGLTDEQRLAKEEEERNVALVEIQLRDEHSFPALAPGLQGEGGRKKGGEKRRSQRNKTKSPVEDVRTPSPSAGERLKPSTPPLAATTARAANATTPPNPSTLPAGRAPAAPPSRSDSKPARFGSLKASTPTVNSSTAAAASSSTPAASTPKTNTNSYALAAGATPTPPSTPPAAAPSTKPSAPPPSVPSSATQFSCLTPALPAASSPPTSRDLSSPSPPPSSKLPSSSLPPKSSPSSPPSLSLPPPTFIAPIAPSPTAAQGFLPSSSLPRSSPPVSSVLHSPSPPTFSSSSSLIHHAAQVQEAPPASAPTPSSLPKTGGTLATSQTFQSQTSLSQVQPRVSLPQNQILTPQTDAQSSVPQPCLQHQPQTEVASLTLTQIQTSSPQVQTRSEVSQEQPSHQAPGAPYPQTSQTPVPVSSLEQPQPSVTHPPVQPVQPPHPSQVPHPSLSLSTSPTHPPLPSQTSDTQSQKEAPLPPTHSQSPDDAPAQQSNPPHPSHHPQLNSAPLLTQSIPAGTPLQQLSQLYQDLLYPGFPQGEKGDVAQTPAYSCHKSGDDLPQDVNILRFFFNLGVKAYSMPMFPPYIYLLPLQQAHTMTPKIPSRSPSPHYPPCNLPSNPPANPPTRHQEAYQYPPTSASMTAQYDHQAPHMEPPQPGDLSFNQTGYPVTQPPPHRMSAPWQQPQIPPPRNPSFQGYPSTSQTYPGPPPLSQGYHSGQASGPPLYPQYPPSSLGYPPSSTPEELQVNQGVMEQCQPISGDMMPGQGSSRAPGLLESPGAANMANANNNLTVVVPGFGGALKKEQGESLTRTVLLVDPPLNNMPILVSNPDIKGLPISMTTMKPSSSPGSPSHYDMISKSAVPADKNPAHGHWSHQSPFTPPTVYPQLGLDRHGQRGYPAPVAMAEPLSMGCNTENYRDEHVFKQRRGQGRGRRGRGGHDSVREAYRRKPGGDAGAGFNPSYRRGGR